MRIECRSPDDGIDSWHWSLIVRRNILKEDWNLAYDEIVAWCHDNVSGDWYIFPNSQGYLYSGLDFLRYQFVKSSVVFAQKEDAAKYLLWFGTDTDDPRFDIC